MKCLKCRLPLNIEEAKYSLHEACFAKWFNVPATAVFSDITRRSAISNSNELIEPIIQNNSFYHGKFKKYSASLNNRAFILKMRQTEAPELPEVEYLCNQIGDELGIPVAKFFIINFEGEQVFVTEDFVHSYKHMIDLKHIHHFRTPEQHNCEDLIKLVKQKTQRPHFVKCLVKTILFDSLVGNHDRHGRNLAFLVMPNATILSPIYDNVSYLSLESGNFLKADHNPVGKIATQLTTDPNMFDYVIELKKLGFASEVAQFFTCLVNGKMEKINRLIDDSFCSELMKQAIKKLIYKRFKELENAWNA